MNYFGSRFGMESYFVNSMAVVVVDKIDFVVVDID